MLIDASAVVAILARQPGCDALLAQLDAAPGPFITTTFALLEAVAGLALVKSGEGRATPVLLGQARDAVAEFAAALGLREVPISADLGRRALDRMVAGDGEAGRCLSAATAQAYRVPWLAT